MNFSAILPESNVTIAEITSFKEFQGVEYKEYKKFSKMFYVEDRECYTLRLFPLQWQQFFDNAHGIYLGTNDVRFDNSIHQ